MNHMLKAIQKQNDWILTTKFNPPLIRSEFLRREKLLERLERNVRRPLTLIAAPAGYGKSTLAAQWLETSSLPGVWISLDEAENDPRTFLSYLVAAIRRHEAKACALIYNILGAPQLPPAEILARLLANDLEEISDPFLLVLDDFHLVIDPDVQELMDRLLQHPPRSLHLVIVTRRDPPFPLVTMKAHGQLEEIRESDLQFDAAETEQVLEQGAGIHLDSDDLNWIMDQIEGWVTGLHLFCLAVARGENPKAHLLGMSGGAFSMQDYLVEQVLSRQPPEIQDCLLKTSLLDRFCAPLCDALFSDCAETRSGGEALSGRQFMAVIRDAKLFGIQLEAGNEWVRYHHLFREMLGTHARRKWSPQDIAAIHRRAAQWFSEQGLIEEGLKHARAAGDSELATGMIEAGRIEAINSDQWARLGRWLDALAPGVENAHPHLLMCRAYLLLHSIRRVREIPALLDSVVALAGEPPADPMLAGELHFFRGIPMFRMGKLEAANRHFHEALRLLPESNEEARALSEMYTYVILHLEGQGESAVQGLRELIRPDLSRSLHYLGRLVFGLSYIEAVAGHWPESFQSAQQLVEFSRPKDLGFAVAWGEYMQGNASLQMLDLEEAGGFFELVFERRYIINPQVVIDALVGLAICRQLQGQNEEADHWLHEARQFANWTGDSVRIGFADSGSARVALLRGDEDGAARWLAACHLQPDLPVKMFFLEYPEITACRVLVARGTPQSLQRAASLLEPLESEARDFSHDCQLVPLLVIKSLLASRQNRPKDALEALAEAVDLAWPGRYLLPFIEGGAMLAQLLEQLPQNPEWGGFVEHALAALVPAASLDVPKQAGRNTGGAPIIDLTNREMEILELLCERLYDKEIATRLNISPATVNTHLSNIYGKLGVTNRRQAARKAARLDLV